MSSASRNSRQMANNALYVNIAPCQSSIFDVNSTWPTKAIWVTAPSIVGALSTPGGAVFRDMGKTVYLPAPTTPNAVAMQSTILRKVQFIQGAGSYYGTGGASGTTGSEFFTGYIQFAGQTYGGGVGGPMAFARAN